MSHLKSSRATFFIVRTSGELKVPAESHVPRGGLERGELLDAALVHQYESAFVTDLSFDVSPLIIAAFATSSPS